MASARPADNILESTPPSFENADEIDLDILDQILNNKSLTEDQIAQLYGDWLNIYQVKTEMRRATELRDEDKQMKKIKCKLQRGIELSRAENQLYDRRGHKVAAIQKAQVEVDAVNILTDIVNGDYTLQDVHTVREGAEAADDKDDLDKSPLQFFDRIVDMVKDQTHDALKTKDPGHFFGSFAAELSNMMMSTQLTDAINQASTAIDLVQGNPLKSNEAKEACESYIKALAMNEAEQKLKQAEKFSNEKTLRRENEEKLPEADSANDEEGQTEQERPKPKHLDFDISDLNFEISFLPSDNPDLYKPLEIISYIGMTKNIS